MREIINIFVLINKKYPLSIYLFIFLFVTTSILETLGISLVIPIIALLLDENFLITLKKSEYSIFFPDYIFSLDRNEAMVFFCAFIIFIYILKSLFIYFSVFNISIFVGRVKAFLTNKLMFNYLHQEYLFYTKKNLSEINNNINQKVNDVSDGVVQSILYVISEILILIGILLLIIIFNQFDVFFIILIFFIFGIILARLMNIKVKNYGLIRQNEIDLKFDRFSKLLGNIREILLIGKFEFAFKNFYNSLFNVAILDAKRQSLQRTPGLILETIGVISLVAIVFYLKYLDYSTTKIIATCTFFAAVSYRSIPSLHKIVFYNSQIKYFYPALDKLKSEIYLEESVTYHDKKIKFENKLELKNIYFQYDNKDTYVINNINLSIKKNKAIGIYGASGSGKTTLLDIISGLIKPHKGEIYVDGNLINDQYTLRKFQNNISYTSQKTTVLNDSLQSNICFGINKENINLNLYKSVLSLSKLQDLENELDHKNFILNDMGKNLSGGQIQRIGIARALYRDNDILIFDEVTSSLDEETGREIIENIKSLRNKTIIIVSHNLDNLKNCDFIYEFKNGKLNLK